THLPILESYTALKMASGSQPERQSMVAAALHNLLKIYCERIVDMESGHTRLFFSENWIDRSSAYSYGHDIESSWLIHEAIRSLGVRSPQALQYMEHVKRLGSVACREGILASGAMADEYRWEDRS